MGWFNRRDTVSDSRLAKPRPSAPREAQAAALRVGARRRLLGAVVLIVVAIIVLPWVLDTEPVSPHNDITIRFTQPSSRPVQTSEPLWSPPDRVTHNGHSRDSALRVPATNGVASPVATESLSTDPRPATESAETIAPIAPSALPTASSPSKTARSRASTAPGGVSHALTTQGGTTHALTTQGGTTHALTTQGGTTHALTTQGGTSRVLTTQGRTSRASVIQDGASHPSSAQGMVSSHSRSEHSRSTSQPPSRATTPAERMVRTDDGSRALALLEGHDIPISSPSQMGEGKESFILQIAAYPTARDAQMRRDKLHGAGVTNAYVQTAGAGIKLAYRLRVGPFSSRAAAQAAQARLRTLGYDNGFIATQ